MLLCIDTRNIPYETVMTLRTRLLEREGDALIEMSEEIHNGCVYVQLDDQLGRTFEASLGRLDGASVTTVHSVPQGVVWTQAPTPPTRVQIKLQSNT